MAEKPIILNADEIRALQAGRLGMVWRPVKPQPEAKIFSAGSRTAIGWDWPPGKPKIQAVSETDLATHLVDYCPFGAPGDRLWVRETWAPGYNHDPDHDDGPTVEVIYWVDGKSQFTRAPGGEIESYEFADKWNRLYAEDGPDDPVVWGPVSLPRWASRYTLEVTSVVVKRVREITEAEAVAAGTYIGRCQCSRMRERPRAPIEACFQQEWCHIHGQEIESAWRSRHGKRYPWDDNPWAWGVGVKEVNHA